MPVIEGVTPSSYYTSVLTSSSSSKGKEPGEERERGGGKGRGADKRRKGKEELANFYMATTQTFMKCEYVRQRIRSALDYIVKKNIL